MPPANWLVEAPGLAQETYPLLLEHCGACGNLQLRDCLAADILYAHYYYMTPESPSLERHYDWLIEYLFERSYVTERSDVLEIGSNRGAFLQALAPHVAGTLGVDPARNVVELARAAGVDTVCDFFNLATAERLAATGKRPSLIVARHCMAHNESPQDMLAGVDRLLAADGVLVIENNYAARMISDGEFDQIYHEHMFYYSLTSLSELLQRAGFRVLDVTITTVHGGSIVCFAAREGSSLPARPAVANLLLEERESLSHERLRAFARRAYSSRDRLRTIVRELRDTGARLAAYGATAKGATLLNFCGFTSAEISECADSTAIKQGRYIPGADVPIVAEDVLLRSPPDYFLLTAWNYKDELIAKTRAAGARDVRFIVPIPEVAIVS